MSGQTPDCLACEAASNFWRKPTKCDRCDMLEQMKKAELGFAMLRERSMLAEMLASEATSDDAFRQGVRRGLSGGTLTAELFSVRASVLLGKLSRISAPSFVSGLLIGVDVAHGLNLAKGDDLYLLGDSDLTRLYSTALATAGHAAKEISGERAFLAGASALARMIK